MKTIVMASESNKIATGEAGVRKRGEGSYNSGKEWTEEGRPINRGGARRFEEEDDAGRRWGSDHRRNEPGMGERNQSFNNRQGNQPLNARDRLGENRMQVGGGEEGNRLQVENRGGSQSGICFWCRQEGHHQADCTNPPFCFRCKESGHLAAKCPSGKETTMHMLGFGFPGQGFHCLKIPGAVKQQSTDHQGLISVEKRGVDRSKDGGGTQTPH